MNWNKIFALSLRHIYLIKGSNYIGLSFIANKLYKLNNTYV